jgi:regulator of protease activity HflC (stomatin/prohibitin superfamily)
MSSNQTTAEPNPTEPRAGRIAQETVATDELTRRWEEANVKPKLVKWFTLGILRSANVPQGYACLLTRFGKYRRTLSSGLSVYLYLWGLWNKPFEILVPTKETVRTIPSEHVITRDGLQCTIRTVVFYTITDPVKATFDVNDYEKAVESLVQATLRNECGNLAARELLASRPRIVESLRKTLTEDTPPWGISVRLVEITDIEMSQGQKAM